VTLFADDVFTAASAAPRAGSAFVGALDLPCGFEPRAWQQRALPATRAAWLGEERGTGVGEIDRAAWSVATGAGKTAGFGEVLAHPELFGLPPGRRVVLVHRQELVSQAKRTVQRQHPGIPVGIVRACVNEVDCPVVVASVPTLLDPYRLEQLVDGLALIVCDEAHHAAAPSWRTVLDRLGAYRGVKTLGVTATMTRSDSSKLGDIWGAPGGEIVHEYGILEAIRDGVLVDPRGRRIQIRGLDLDAGTSRGEVSDKVLAEKMHDAEAPQQIVEGWIKEGEGRPTVGFFPTVAYSREVLAAFRAAGIAADLVTDSTPTEKREAIYARSLEYALRGEPHVLINCMCLTEGFDAPWLSCIIVGRPTQHSGLYQQMCGRVLRAWSHPDTGAKKTDALILDCAGASERHSLQSVTDLTAGVAKVNDGESLLEALDREELEELTAAANDLPEPEPPAGEIVGSDFDPFSVSDVLWRVTDWGYYYLSTSKWIRFLVPQPNGLVSVWVVPNAAAHGKWMCAHVDMDFEYARKWVEGISKHYDPKIVKKDAGWRKRWAPASDKSLRFLHRLGGTLPDGSGRTEVNDEIGRRVANLAIHGRVARDG